MGGQLAKFDIPDPRRSAKIVQSNSQEDQAHTNLTSASTLVVVNRGPAKSKASTLTTTQTALSLPPLQPPLIPVGQTILKPTSYPHLSPQPLLDLALEFQAELHQQAENTANKQQNIVELIKDIDQQIERASSFYLLDKQRRLNRAVENFDRLGEIESLVERCQADIELLTTEFTRLNRALPEPLRLEYFAQPSGQA